MVWVEALIPFDKGELLSTIHQVGMVERTVSISSILNSFIFLLIHPLSVPAPSLVNVLLIIVLSLLLREIETNGLKYSGIQSLLFHRSVLASNKHLTELYS